MGMMTVYHGGYQAVEKPEIRKGRNTKDFGTGFYCTVIKEQAERWARRYDTKVVSIYDVRVKEKLNIKEFKDMSEEWLDFIIACRSGKSHTYDIVIGAMADDQIYNYVSDYMDGVITREQFWVLAKFRYPNSMRILLKKNRNEDQWYFLQMVSKQKLLITNIRNEKYQHFILNEISKSFLIFRQ